MDTRSHATRAGIEALTVWLEDERHNAAAHIGTTVCDSSGPRTLTTVAGLLNLSMIMGMELAAANDVPPDEMRTWLQAHLRELSLKLPED